MKMDRPNVYVYVTASLDGRIALSPDATLYNPNNVNLDKYPQLQSYLGAYILGGSGSYQTRVVRG